MHNNTTFKKQYGPACLDSSDLSFKSIYAGDACSKDGSPTPSMIMGTRQNCPSPDFRSSAHLYEGDTETASGSYQNLCNHISWINLRPPRVNNHSKSISGVTNKREVSLFKIGLCTKPISKSHCSIVEPIGLCHANQRHSGSRPLTKGGSK